MTNKNGNGGGLYLPLPADYKLDHRLLDLTPITAETMVKVAELQHARPAEEATKQEVERTAQTKTIARHQTLRAAMLPTVAILGVIAACMYPEARGAIAGIVGILAAPSAIEKFKKPKE